jgi:hypothetical protein
MRKNNFLKAVNLLLILLQIVKAQVSLLDNSLKAFVAYHLQILSALI